MRLFKIAFLILIMLRCGAYHRKITYQGIMAKTEDWPTVNKTEEDFKKFLDENYDTLDPIEGIWIIQEGGTWCDISSGAHGTLPEHNPYYIAIVRTEVFEDFENYDFVAVILESVYSWWLPGRVKALFCKTADDYTYDGCWYMKDYKKSTGDYIIVEPGVIRWAKISYDDYIKYIHEVTFIKDYPLSEIE